MRYFGNVYSTYYVILKEIVKSWRCSRYGRNCRATVNEVLGEFQYYIEDHNHEAEPAISRSVELVKNVSSVFALCHYFLRQKF